MCLAVPAQLLSIEGEGLTRTGKVSVGGAVKEVNLAFLPTANVDDYVLVHAGIALSLIDEQAAQRVVALLQEQDDA